MNEISKGTILRTACLAVTIVNLILTESGHTPLPFDSDGVNEAVTCVSVILASLVAWWKNNSFTETAIRADGFLQTLRRGEPIED